MSNQNKSNTDTKNSKEKWLYVFISGLTAVILSFIYAILTRVEIVQAIIMIIATVFIIGLICFFGYLISKSNLRSVESSLNEYIKQNVGTQIDRHIKHLEESETSLNNYIKQNIETPIDRHIKHLGECCKRMEIYSKQNKIATIDYEQISDFVRAAKTIWVMNPLSDLSFMNDDIKTSIKNECVRKYIVPKSEHVWYINRVKEICNDLKINQVNFDLLPINPKYLFPLSFVICDPDKPSKTRVWVQPRRNMTKDSLYGLYIEDETVVSQFVGTFSLYSSRLFKGGS